MTNAQRLEVRKLISQYQDVFESANSRGKTDLVNHRIDTGDARPIRQGPRRLPLAKREEAEQIIQEMAQDGVIEPLIVHGPLQLFS